MNLSNLLNQKKRRGSNDQIKIKMHLCERRQVPETVEHALQPNRKGLKVKLQRDVCLVSTEKLITNV